MNAIVNLFGKLAGFGNILKKLDGAKTYVGGGILLLTGGAKVLLGAAAVAGAVVAVNDAAGALALVKGFMALPGVAEIQSGASVFASGLIAVGLRHAIAKQDEPAAPEPPKG